MPTNRRPNPAYERAALEARRLQAAELFAQGRTQAEVAIELGVSRQSAHVWHARFQQGGVASAAEIDEMLAERVATRVAAGPLWPMQAGDWLPPALPGVIFRSGWDQRAVPAAMTRLACRGSPPGDGRSSRRRLSSTLRA